MNKVLKRFKLSEWLIISQIVLSMGTLFLTTILGSDIIDIVGLIGNVINGAVLIVVFFSENSKNIKSHELMGQFIFNQVGDNFGAFMDFLMSDQYENIPFDERNVLHRKLIEMAQSDDYDIKRKLSRAIPHIFDIDQKMAMDIIEILRKDIYNDRTDIRRRTLEAALSIIQRQPNLKKQKKYAQKFFDLFSYHKYDDSYTIVACIECYYFVHDFVFSKKEIRRCLAAFEELKKDTIRAYELGIGCVEECLVNDMGHIWDVLSALSTMQSIKHPNYAECKRLIDETLIDGAKFSKLTVVKNLYYTCEGFPECLSGCKCNATSSKYMMEKISGFLNNMMDNNIFLAMPTVRYFDCVCNNICKSEAKKVARSIIHDYFASDELLIPQTAFDKFSKLLKEDSFFALSVLQELLAKETALSVTESRSILDKIKGLSGEERVYFVVDTSRVKLRVEPEYDRAASSISDEAKEVHDLIHSYNSRIRFIGKIKKFKEEHQL